jgi:hypothetical protein
MATSLVSTGVTFPDSTTQTTAAGAPAPVGALQYFAGTTSAGYPSSDWLACNGQAISQASYPTLYSRIGLIPNTVNTTWTSRTSGTSSSIRAIIYGNNTWVRAGAGGSVGTSTDAITWTSRTSGVITAIYGLGYGNGVFVRVGQNGDIGSSTDGITWTSRTSWTGRDLFTVTYGNLGFVATGSQGVAGYSTDGVTWTGISNFAGTIYNLYVTHANGIYMAGRQQAVYYSTNLSTWTNSAAPGSAFGTSAVGSMATSTNTQIWIFSNANEQFYSTNLTTWTSSSLTGGGAQAITSGLGYFVATRDGRAWSSTNAAAWSASVVIPGTNDNYGLAYGNGLFVEGGVNGALGTNAATSYNASTLFITPTAATITAFTNVPQTLYIKAL